MTADSHNCLLWGGSIEPLVDARWEQWQTKRGVEGELEGIQGVLPQCYLLSTTGDALQLIEYAGRVSYKSQPKAGGPAEFVRMLIKRGHESVLEHASCSFHLITDRGITHELVRHRIGAAYTQESTRFCNYREDGRFGGIQVLLPSTSLPENAPIYWEAFANAQQSYEALIQAGEKPQNARAVLPTGLKTEIVVTMNFRALRHLFMLRTAPDAHPDIRLLCRYMLALMLNHYFPAFETYEPRLLEESK